MAKEESIRIRVSEREKAALLRVLDKKYLGASISEWFRRKLGEEVEAYEREHGPIDTKPS